jgi:uncharacterized protein (TIGR00369 family)
MIMTELRYGVAAGPAEVASLTGKQILQGIIDGRLPHPPMSRSLSFWITEVGDGLAVFEGEPGEHLFNPMGGVHGGWALTLIDSACGAAGHTTLPAGVGYGTLETKANFVRAIAPTTGTLRCEGRVLAQGRTILTAEAKLTDAADKLYAHGTSTCMILRPENRS